MFYFPQKSMLHLNDVVAAVAVAEAVDAHMVEETETSVVVMVGTDREVRETFNLFVFRQKSFLNVLPLFPTGGERNYGGSGGGYRRDEN